MDKKAELQVLNISSSQVQVGAYAIVLGEAGGERQLPIIIGPVEAQVTAICLKGIETLRLLTYDLFYSRLNVLGASLFRVLIYKAKEGVFCSYIYFKRDEEIIRVDTRTSDAVTLAVRADCPILIYESILEREYIWMIDGAERSNSLKEDDNSCTEAVSITSPEEALSKAIQEENYELAARLCDEMNRYK